MEATMKDSTVLEILNQMNQLIYNNLKTLACEQCHPSREADESDQLIADCLKRHQKLIKIRAEFEIVCSDAIIKGEDKCPIQTSRKSYSKGNLFPKCLRSSKEKS